MEREINSIQIRLRPEHYAPLMRCVKDDFLYYYQECKDTPEEDHSDDLDKMEEDMDLLEALLPSLGSRETDDPIRLTLAEFRRKIAEVA